MWLKVLGLEHFGQFSGKRLELKQGLNLIYGENESGKTTVHCFIKGMLFGIEKGRGREGKKNLYEKYRPWDTPTLYGGYMELEAGGRAYRIIRSFYRDTKDSFYIDLETGRREECLGALPFLDASFTKAFYENTISAGQDEAPVNKELSGLLRRNTAGTEEKIDLKKALSRLGAWKKELRLKETEEAVKEAEKVLEETQEKEKQWETLNEAFLSAKKEYDEMNNRSEEAIKQKGRGERGTGLLWGLPGLALLFLGAAAYSSRLFSTPACISLLFCGIFLSGLGVFLWQSLVRKKREESARQVRIAKGQKKEEARIKLERLRWEMQNLEEYLSHKEEWLFKRDERLRVLQDKQENLQAISLAEEVLTSLAGEEGEKAGLSLGTAMAEFIEWVTEGSYNGIYVDGDLMITVRRGEGFADASRLSRGTKDEISLGLRIAAGESVFKGESLPLLLDDSLAFYDDRRMGRTLSYLAGLDRQVLIFTCQNREREYLREHGIQFHHVVL